MVPSHLIILHCALSPLLFFRHAFPKFRSTSNNVTYYNHPTPEAVVVLVRTRRIAAEQVAEWTIED